MSTKRNFSLILSLLCALIGPVAAQEIAIEQPAGTNLTANRVVGFGWNNQGQTTIPANLTGVIAIEAGEASSAALKVDGSVVGWGQINNLPAFTGVKAISVGGTYGHGLKTDGTLVNWGGAPSAPNTNGNLAVSVGMGWSAALQTSTCLITWGSNLPTWPGSECGYVGLSAGDFHLLGLRDNGTVKAFGNNSNGQSLIPTDLANVTAVAAGRRFSLALLSNGTVRGWGFNDNGGGSNVVVPAGLNNVVAIAANGHALALKSDGTVVGWGRSVEGQLTLPAGVGPVRAIAAGGEHSLALVGNTLSYGRQLVGSSTTKTFVIKNTGSAALIISGINLFGAQSTDFSIHTAGMLSSVPAGGQTSFSVSFAPTLSGERRTMLRVINNDADEASFETLLDGDGYAVPEIAVFGHTNALIADGDDTPSLLDGTDFGEVRMGGFPLSLPYTIANLGNRQLNLGAVTISGEHAGDFDLPSPIDTVVQGGLTTRMLIRFTPRAPGLRQAVITIPNDDSDENPYNFVIQGLGAEPEIAVTTEGNDISNGGSGVDFGEVDVANPVQTLNFTIHNQGFGTLTLGPINFGFGHSGAFTVLNPPPTSIGSHSSVTFQVRFAPSTLGSYSTTVGFENGDRDENPFNFPIRGSLIAVEMDVSGNSTTIVDGDSTPSVADNTEFGSTDVSGEITREFVIRNTGTAGALRLGPVSISGPGDFVVRDAPAATVAPGASTTLKLAFAPTARGVRNAVVSIANNDVDENPFDFAVQGSATAPELLIEREGVELRSALVRAWGSTDAGRLDVPAGLMGVVQLDGGFGHTLARKADGTVLAWGENQFGQASVPPGLRGVIDISASRFHSVALRADGTVVAWGNCSSGQCDVSHLRDITAIAAGETQTYALKSDGTVLAFGANPAGQIDVPANLNHVVAIAAGVGHVLALKNDGAVVCWGLNSSQQCAPQTETGFTALAGGQEFSLARRPNGTLLAWGSDNNETVSGATALQGAAEVALGTYHGLARNVDGALIAWGWNNDNQLSVPADIAVNGTATVGAIGAGDRHSVAATNPGLVFASGEHGAAHARVLTIRNTGLDPLPISSFSLTGRDANDFSVDSSAVPSILSPGAQTSISVISHASSGDTRLANVRIRSADADEGTFDIALKAEFTVAMVVTGNGVTIANGDDTPNLADHTDFGSLAFPATFTRTFTIRNLGTGTLRVSAPSLANPFYFSVIQAPPATIAAGESASFQVRFAPPQAFGPMQNAISFTSNDVAQSPFSFTIKARTRQPGPGDISGPASDVLGTVFATAIQGNGQVLIGGDFSQVGGQARQNLARLNADGSVDSSFTMGANGIVRSIAALPGGGFLVAGEFTSIAGVPRFYVARFSATSALDTSFAPNPSAAVDQVLVDQNDRILLAGNFLTLQPTGTGTPIARAYLARISAAGAVDSAFNPSPDGRVRALALQDDGSILLGGEFLNLRPNGGAAIARGRFARITENGAVDPSVDVSVNGTVRSLAIYSYGPMFLGGDFTTLSTNGNAAMPMPYLASLAADGSLRELQATPNGPVWTLAVSSENSLYLGGAFTQLQTALDGNLERTGFAILPTSGVSAVSADAGLASGAPFVAAVALGTDEKMLLGGRFETIAANGEALPTPRANLARLRNFAAPNALTQLSSGDGFFWNQQGGGPLLRRASFDISTDGGNSWTALGYGFRNFGSPSFRILTSIPLPDAYRLRARGTVASGTSTSQTEQIVDFDFLAGPKMEFRGNNVVIRNIDLTPSLADHTDFGSVSAASGFIERTFTIKNIGALPLTVDATGFIESDFTVQNTPATSLAPGQSTPLTIRFDPSTQGIQIVRLAFNTNDPLARPFDIRLQGEGLGNIPGAPTIVSATALSGGARISFSAASSSAGPILDYSATCTPGNVSATQNALSIDVVGLTNNVAHRCSVRARNAEGQGPSSASLSVIPGSSGTSADLSITKSNGRNFVNGAAPVDYLITVSNAGPAGVVDARVSDAIGTGTDFSAATWQCTGLNGAACPSSGSGALDASVDVPSGALVQFIFSALPNTGSETPISNVASVTPPAAISDPNLSNNVASDGPDIRGIFRNGFE